MSELSIDLFASYSEQYDYILDHSIPYQNIINLVRDTIHVHIRKDEPIKVLDVGAGTGNFSKMLLETLHYCTIDFLEPSLEMMEYAKAKLDYARVNFITESFEDFHSEQQYDLIVCIHALYLMRDPEAAIPKFRTLLSPSGILILCDIGKKLNIIDWTIYYFFSFWKHYGLGKTIELFSSSGAFFSGNKRIKMQQSRQKAWRHNLKSLKMKFLPYFQRVDGCMCFRGYSGFLVCG